MRFELAIPHPRREWLILAANLPFPYSITVRSAVTASIIRLSSDRFRACSVLRVPGRV